MPDSPFTTSRGKIIVSSVVITYLIIELILRLSGFRINTIKETSNLPIAKPNAVYTNVGVAGRPNEYSIIVTNNSYGQNDVEHSKEKPVHTVRILVIGDSFVNANQVQPNQTFFRQLEGALNKVSKNNHYEAIAFGGHGAGPLQYWWLLQNQGLAFKPDIVLVEFLPENDVTSTVGQLQDRWVTWQKQAGRNQLVLAAQVLPLVFSSRLIELGLYSLDQMRTIAITIDPDWFVYCANPPDRQRWDAAWDTTKYAYLGMENDAKKAGADFYIVTFTSQFEIDAFNGKHTLPPALKSYNCDAKIPNNKIDQIAKDLHLNYLNLNPLFAKREKESGLSAHYRFDRHWNSIGHTWAAQEIVNAFGFKILERQPK